MKKLILVIAFIFAIGTSKAQDSVVYKSVLGDSIAEWYMLQLVTSGGEGITKKYTVSTEDTIILSDTIYNIYRCNDDFIPEGCHGFQGFPNDFTNYDKYIRESEDRSKLYFRTSLSNSETLLMDLNLEVGDTVDTETWIWNNVSYNDHPIVVDSVYYFDGKKHIRTNYYISMRPIAGSFVYDTLKFIEGMGPSFGITYIPSIMLAGDSYYKYVIICYYRDDIREYSRLNSTMMSCYVSWFFDGINEANDISVSLYPNPVKDKLFITDLTAEEHTIQIISPIGAIIKTIKTLGPEIEIDLNGLPNGVYNIRISNRNGSTTKKIIKL